MVAKKESSSDGAADSDIEDEKSARIDETSNILTTLTFQSVTLH